MQLNKESRDREITFLYLEGYGWIYSGSEGIYGLNGLSYKLHFMMYDGAPANSYSFIYNRIT